MEWVETTGKTVAEAKDAALDRLGVDEHDAEFEVVEEAKQGLFGRLRTEARVRARIRPTSPRSREDGRDRRRRRAQTSDAASSSTASAPAQGAPVDQSPTDARGANATQGEQAAATEVRVPFAPPPPPADVADEGRIAGGRTAPGRSSEQRTSGHKGSDHRGENRVMDNRQVDGDVPLLEQADVGRDFLTGLLDAFAADGTIDVRERPEGVRPGGDREEVVELAISGPELGLLIGPQGATLNAIQELTRTVVFRRTGGRNGRLVVDVGGYREKRSAALASFVRDVAAEVLRTGTRTALEPMHAADRKVVHDTVNSIDGVATVSEGEDPRRRVVLDAVDRVEP